MSLGTFHAIALLCLFVLPALTAADDGPATRQEANRRRIGEMTPPERAQLEENLRSFQSMPTEQQARLRELQRAIENDSELKIAFDDYLRWANSLSPGQRNVLRRTTDPRERMNLIEEFQNAPPRGGRPGEPPPPTGRRPFDPPPPTGGPGFPGRGDRVRLMEKLLGHNFPLGDRMVSSVPEMAAIVQVLEQQLPSEQRSELDKLDPFSRKVRVVRLTMERHPTDPPPVRIFGGPDSTTFERILSALPESGQVKQFVRSRPNPEAQRAALFLTLIRGLGNELLRTIEDHPLNSDAIRRYSESLPPQERQRLNEFGRDERFVELQQSYLKEQVPGIRELQEILASPVMEKFFRETMLRMQNPGPRGPKGQFDTPESSDRPFSPPRPEENPKEERPAGPRYPDRRKMNGP